MPTGFSGWDQMFPQKEMVRKPPYLWAIGTNLAKRAMRDAWVLELRSLASSKPQNCSA